MEETLKVNRRKLYSLLVQWHYDGDGCMSEREAKNKARNYARRFLTRLKNEALEK